MTETYACQTCFIPITNYFRVFTRHWLTFSTRLARSQYISQHAHFIRPLSKLAVEKEVRGDAKRRTEEYTQVHKDSSAVSTKQLLKRVIVQGTRIRSVHKAMGSPKDHITYCSIPDVADLLPDHGKTSGFSSNCNKAYLPMQQRSTENPAPSQENKNISYFIEPLRNFEPDII